MPRQTRATRYLVIVLVIFLHANGLWADDDIVPIDPNFEEAVEWLLEKLRDLLTGGSSG